LDEAETKAGKLPLLDPSPQVLLYWTMRMGDDPPSKVEAEANERWSEHEPTLLRRRTSSSERGRKATLSSSSFSEIEEESKVVERKGILRW